MGRKPSQIALNDSEITLLEPIAKIVSAIVDRYRHAAVDQEQAAAINNLQDRDFIMACKNENIDTKEILKIYKKVSRMKWYSVFISGAEFKDDGSLSDNAIAIFSLITSDNHRDPIIITPKDYPDFNSTFANVLGVSTDQYYEDLKKALRIPSEYKFLPIQFYEVLYSTNENFDSNGPKRQNIGGHSLKSVQFPVDKISRTMLKITENDLKDVSKNHPLPIHVEREGDVRNIHTLFALDFSGLKKELNLPKNISAFDLYICLFADALTKAGNRVVTYSQIYRAMSGGKIGGADDFKRIDEALTKVGTVRLYLNNEEESKAYKYDDFRYDAPFLPFKRTSAYVNGQLAESAIALYEEWPLLSYAKAHGQVSEISVTLLQAPINRTENNLRVQNYLLGRILSLKNGHMKVKTISYDTVAEEAGIEKGKPRQRVKGAVIKYLNYYVTCGFILGYKEVTLKNGKNGVEIAITENDVKRLGINEKKTLGKLS